MSLLLDGDNGESLPGSLTFTSLAARISGDFTNATHSNRVLFQSNTINGATSVGAIPNGTATTANFTAWGSSNVTNASYINIVALGGSETRIQSSYVGTGTSLPLVTYIGSAERMRIEADTAARIKTTAAVYNTRVAANTGTMDLSLGNNFNITPTGPITLTFTNQIDGQTGIAILNNSGGYAISKTTVIGADANFLTTISTAGIYILFYSSGAGIVRVSYSQNANF